MTAAPSLHLLKLRLGLLFIFLLSLPSAWADSSLAERYYSLQRGTVATLPGTTIALDSSEQQGVVAAEASSILPYPFEQAAPALSTAENWCQFMPLHFNIKACTYQQEQGQEMVTLYSGRKTYQSPDSSHPLTYHVARRALDADTLALQLVAAEGPAGTSDYRIELNAMRVKEGTLLHIRSSYRPSLTSSILTRTYLSTLGRNKVGFSRIEQDGEQHLVQGVRGVIERNVMRYHLAIDTFLNTRQLPETTRHTAALARWFRLNESYPQQLHEMSEQEYLAIKAREWQNQQQLQRTLGERQKGVVL